MTYFLYFSAIISGMIFRKSKVVSIYILLSMYLLAAFNYDNADYENYEMGYGLVGEKERYVGYSLFTQMFGKVGIEYSLYLKILFAILFLLLFALVISLTNRPNVVLSCYMIFPFPMDVVQLKSFCADLIALAGISVLFNKVNSEKCRKFDLQAVCAILLGILSLLLHFSAAYYLLAGGLFYLINNRDRIGRRIFTITLLGFVALYSGLFSAVLNFSNRLEIISEVNYLQHLGEVRTRFGFLITFTGVFLFVGAFYIKKNIEKDIFGEVRLDSESYQKTQIVIKQFMFTMMLTLPLLFLGAVYDRLLRNYFILMYIYTANESETSAGGRFGVVPVSKLCSKVMLAASASIFWYTNVYAFREGTLLAILRYSELF